MAVPNDTEPPEAGPSFGVTAVVPVLNEEQNLQSLDADLRRGLAEVPGHHEIIYVDDGSRDRSFAVLEALAAQDSHADIETRIVRLRRNYGQTSALAAGFSLARGAVVVALDADRQNNPADIPRLVAKLSTGYDVVSGWRRRRQDRLARVLPSRAANALIALATGVKLHDYGCTLKAYRREMLEGLHLYGEMHRFIPVYLARLGARVAELEVDHRPRTTGRSNYGFRRVPKVALDLVLVLFMSRYFDRPMHFFGQAALFFGSTMFGLGLLMLALKYGWLSVVGVDYRASFVETPLPALAATFLTATVLSLFLGILGELLIRVYYELHDKVPYSIERIVASPQPRP